MSNLKDKNLLVISHTYNSFIKDPVEVMSKYFNKIYVLVRHQPLSELGNIIPLKYFRSRAKYSKRYSIDLTNKPENVEVIPTSFLYSPYKSRYLKAGGKHAKKVIDTIEKKDIHFDLIHSHFLWSAGYAGAQVKQQYQKPLILTAHGYDIYDLPYRNEKFGTVIKDVLSSADKVLTVSESNNKHLKELGVENAKIFPNGYRKDLFYYIDKQTVKEKLNLPLDKKIVLTVGNLESVKGYEYLVKALDTVRKQEPNVLCLHIGAGSLENPLKEMVTSLGLEKNIEFLGRKPHDKLVDYFGASEFFISSSLSEGNPTVMFESLGCGKPFIGTRVGGVPDVINSTEYGLLCEASDEKALAQNITKALNTDWNTKKILKYADQYSWENICKNILEIYEEVLK